MIEVTFVRNQDYLDGDNRGPYRWLINVSIWKIHFIVGLTEYA